MKKFIIGLLGKFPICIGLLLLLICCHFTGIKDFREPWSETPEIFWDVIIIYLTATYILIKWWFPLMNEEKNEHLTWIVIFTSIMTLIILAIFFAS